MLDNDISWMDNNNTVILSDKNNETIFYELKEFCYGAIEDNEKIFYELEEFCYGAIEDNAKNFKELIENYKDFDFNYFPEEEDPLLIKCGSSLEYEIMEILIKEKKVDLNVLGKNNYDALSQCFITYQNLMEQICVICDDYHILKIIKIFLELYDSGKECDEIILNDNQFSILYCDFLKRFFDFDERIKIIRQIENGTFVGKTDKMDKIIMLFVENGYNIRNLLKPNNFESMFYFQEINFFCSHFCFTLNTLDCFKYFLEYGITSNEIVNVWNEIKNNGKFTERDIKHHEKNILNICENGFNIKHDVLIFIESCNKNTNFGNNENAKSVKLLLDLIRQNNDGSNSSFKLLFPEKIEENPPYDQTFKYIVNLFTMECIKYLNYDILNYLQSNCTISLHTKN